MTLSHSVNIRMSMVTIKNLSLFPVILRFSPYARLEEIVTLLIPNRLGASAGGDKL